jgi:signal transduction histidine kinase
MSTNPGFTGPETNDSALPRRTPEHPARALLRPLRLESRATTLAYAWRLAVVGLSYFAAGKLGLSLASIHPSATSVWPGTGIAIASLLLLGPRVWPGILIGAFLVNITTAGSFASALGIATGNTLEGILAAALARRFARGVAAFERASDTFRYAAFTAVACMVSATFGVLSLALTGFAPWSSAGAIWLTWWLGDIGGAFIVAPFILVWSQPDTDQRPSARLGEAVVLVTLVTAMAWAVYHVATPLAFGITLQFLFVPPLLWAAFRFNQRMETLLCVILSVMAVWGMAGRTDGTPWSPNSSLLIMQVFLSTMAVTKMGVTALVAERRRATAALQTSSEQLREAVTQIEAYSHAISHDLRTPLSTVNNCVTLIKEDHGDQLGSQGTYWLNKIEEATDSATRMLRQLELYAWSKPQKLDSEVLDMMALAREAYEEVARTGYEVGDVRFELLPLPPAIGSPALIMRVFRNLFSNAVKYTRQAERRRIVVRGIAGPTENTYLVSDNGMGFDPADGGALFEPFQRQQRAHDIEGTGIGLAIVAKIIQRHGGRVWAESDGRSGAQFGFTLRSPGARG